MAYSVALWVIITVDVTRKERNAKGMQLSNTEQVQDVETYIAQTTLVDDAFAKALAVAEIEDRLVTFMQTEHPQISGDAAVRLASLFSTVIYKYQTTVGQEENP